jgi:hypothetical protein
MNGHLRRFADDAFILREDAEGPPKRAFSFSQDIASVELALRAAGIPPVRSPLSDLAVPAVHEEFGPIALRLRSACGDRSRLRAVSRTRLLAALLLYGPLVALRCDMDVFVRHHFTSLSCREMPSSDRATPNSSTAGVEMSGDG